MYCFFEYIVREGPIEYRIFASDFGAEWNALNKESAMLY